MPGPTIEDKRRLFRGHALFGKLPPGDLDALLRHARVERYEAGSEIFAKGSPGRSMMAILTGRVRIEVQSAAYREVVLAILHPGEVFGEIALLDGADRTADATAIDDSELLVLDHRDFIPFLEQHAELCVLLLRMLCGRLRRTTQQVGEVMFGRLDSRLANALIRLAHESSAENAKADGAALRVSQQELAGMVGASRESVNKLLRQWQREGMLRLGKRLVEIPDLSAIEALV